jgi:S1-C subfamily serine protease
MPLMAVCAASGWAQTPVPPTMPQPSAQAPKAETPKTKPQKSVRRPSRQVRVTMVTDQEAVAPQVVTIVHRLSGVKLARQVQRESGERAVVTINPEDVTNDAHASIIAGWALEDGKTIAARLPQAAAEMEVQRFSRAWSDEKNNPNPNLNPGSSMVWAPRVSVMQPDLTVMMQDGKTHRAKYVGIDGRTGLSILQLSNANTAKISEADARKFAVGQNVQLFAPERVATDAAYTIRVRIGKTDAKIAKAKEKALLMDRVMLKAARLSPNVIGGVACDAEGNTLGIVDAVEGNDARILTADAVRAAARRVLARQASVPRPLLGIRGEAIDEDMHKTFLAFGWDEKKFEELYKNQIGILLTQVLPNTPAAMAKLRPGDVIVSVDSKDVKSAEEFSAMLSKAGSGEEVKFVVQRPKADAAFELNVILGGAFQPLFEWQFKMPQMPKFEISGLNALGVETVALSKSSAQGGGVGLLVVSIEPESAAARAGLKEGDVIESIDGRAVGRGAWTFLHKFENKDKHVFSVVREREKKQLVVGPVE